ncbi:MAG: 6-phosphogluconolactonase, partial [Candidatus Omnitrophica bacterium]|nr:6-phosphogluconolactonase [Candidatus Omnitrophota bacterium]
TFVRRLVDYKCVDFIIDVLYDDSFRERVIAADGVVVVGGRKFSEFSDLQQQRIRQLVEKDPRMKFRIIFISNHNVYTSWMIHQGTSFGGMLSWMGKEAGPTSYANAQQNGAPTFATLDGVIPERLIPITRDGEAIIEGTGYAVAYGSERSYSNDIKPDRESFVAQFEAACADYRNAAVYGALAYNALLMGVTNGDIRNQSKGLLMVWATEIQRIQASMAAAESKDGGYTGMPRIDAMRQLNTYLSGYRHGQVGLSQLPAEIGAAAFKQAVTYLRSIPRIKRWRAPRIRVWVIETRQITFGAIYDAQGNIFIERAFLNKIQHGKNPSMMLTRVFIHELNGSSHFMNRVKEYLFVLDSFVAKNSTLLILACIWGITAVSFAYAVLDYLFTPASSGAFLHISMGVIFVLGLTVLAEWIARDSFGPQSAKADKKEFYKWLSLVCIPLFIVLSISLMSPVLFGVDFISAAGAAVSKVSIQELSLALYFFILMLPWLLKTLFKPVSRSGEAIDFIFASLNEAWKAPRAAVTKGKKPAAKRLGDVLNYGLIPLGKGVFAALGAAYLASAVSAGEVIFGLGTVVEMTVVFALLDILKKAAGPAIGMMPKLPKQIISIGLSLTPWMLIAWMSLFLDNGLQAGAVNEAVFGPIRDFVTSKETHNAVLNTCIAIIAGFGISGFFFYKWESRQAKKHGGDWSGVNMHVPGCLITAAVLSVLLAGFVIPFVRENCGLILTLGALLLGLSFGGMKGKGEPAAKPADKPAKPAAPAQPAKAKGKINIKKAVIWIAVLVVLGIILALLLSAGAEARSLAAYDREFTVTLAGFAPRGIFGWIAFAFSTLLIGMCARGEYIYQLPAEQESLRAALDRSGAIALRRNTRIIKAVSFNGSVINSDKYNRQALELVRALKEAGIELFIVSENADREALLAAVQRKGFLGLVEEDHIYNVWPAALRSLAVSAGIPVEYLSKWYALNKIKDDFGYDKEEIVHLDDTPDVVHEAMEACLAAGVLSRMEHFDAMAEVRPDYLIKDLSDPSAILAALGIIRKEEMLWLEIKDDIEADLCGLPEALRRLERGVHQRTGYATQFTFAVDIPVINEGICFSAGASAKSYVLPEGGIMRAGYLQGKPDTYPTLKAYIDSLIRRLLAAGIRLQDVRVVITRTGAPWDIEVRLELIRQSGNLSFPLAVGPVSQAQAEARFGTQKTVATIQASGFALSKSIPAQLKAEQAAIRKRLEALKRMLGRAPPVLSSWVIVITTDLTFTQGNVAACNIDTRTVYLHPYFFDLAEAKQIEILYHELISHIAKGLRDEDEAMRDTQLMMRVHVVSAGSFARTTAYLVAEEIRRLQRDPERFVNIVFATGNTMVLFLDFLSKETGIDWVRVRAFHLDEYKGLPTDSPYSFAYFLHTNIFSKVPIPPENIHYVNGAHPNLAGYMRTLRELGGADIVLLGVGMDGHLAFNEPPHYSSFSGRMQEIRVDESTILANEADYPGIRDNPYAYTMGMADIFEGRHLFFFANKPKKASIVRAALLGPVTEDVPASILQRHANVTIVLDEGAAELIKDDLTALRMPEMSLSEALLHLRESLEVSASNMQDIVTAFLEEMERGLAGSLSSLRMLPSYTDNPTGKEKGLFLALDLGGTNFRVLMVELKGDGSAPVVTVKKFKLTQKQITTSGEALFDAVAKHVKSFLKEYGYEGSYELGYTFSFPIEQAAIDQGSLIVWTKGFSASGVEGEDLIELLEQAFQRNGVARVKVVSLDNDTVGTQVARAYLDTLCDIAVILGTGTNACVRLPVSAITKAIGAYTGEFMIINMESGNFNRNLPLTPYDRLLDEDSVNPGRQWQEKMVSGKYLGEVTRLILLDLISRGLLFGGRTSEALTTPYAFDTKHMSVIERDRSSNRWGVRMQMRRLGIEGVTFEEAKALQQICGLISLRAARVAAPTLVATIEKADPGITKSHVIAVDGSIYEKYPHFAENIEVAFIDLLGADKAARISMAITHDGSGIGAAIIAAIVALLKNAALDASSRGLSRGKIDRTVTVMEAQYGPIITWATLNRNSKKIREALHLFGSEADEMSRSLSSAAIIFVRAPPVWGLGVANTRQNGITYIIVPEDATAQEIAHDIWAVLNPTRTHEENPIKINLSLGAVSFATVQNAWQYIQGTIRQYDVHVAEKKVAFLSRLYHALERTFAGLAEKAAAQDIDIFAKVNLLAHSPEDDDPRLHDLEREINVGFFPIAGNPLNWGHVLP